ncbi:MAG: carbon starvation CstA family protein [Pirellulales bacterium]
MNLLVIVVPVAVVLTIAYFTYGRVLSRLLRLDAKRPTPAVELRDDLDYSPIEPKFLLSQHFSAIAAAGPIVGPILAGVMFGWLPALIWILVGSIFIGGVHDMTALVASIRHKARSIAEVVRDHMTQRSYYLFLAFVWLALVYIIVAFTDVTASSFIGRKNLETGQEVTAVQADAMNDGDTVSGGGIATSSLLYLVLPIVMGLLLRYTKLSLNMATLIFVPLVGVAIWVGQYIPLDLAQLLDISNPQASKVWDVLILGYCLIAAVVPMWMLLQPRGHLGGYFLYAALGAAAIGLIVGGKTIQYPAFTSWTTPSGASLAPMLFITIACGACSGFHSMIASGTTSKQLRLETDALPIGYGAMLLEAMVATISLCCVMVLVPGSPTLKSEPNFIYALGIGGLLEPTGISAKLAVSFALMAFTTFVYDTLDVCTRLGRYIIQELLGMQNTAGKWLGTILTAGVPLFFVVQTAVDASGNPIPIWKLFWSLFGASNQLLAALSLLGVTVWLWRTRRAMWVWFVTGIPTVVMYVMSTWALVQIIGAKLQGEWYYDAVTWVAIVLVALAALMLVEAVRVLWDLRTPTSPAARGAVAAS